MNVLNSLTSIRTVQKYPWFLLIILLVVFFLTSVFVINHYETEKNPDLNLLESFRMSLVFFLGEYGDTPETNAGKAVSIILFISGIGVVATVIGKIASSFVNVKMEVKMPKNLNRHIVMCNWNDSAESIIKELHSPLGEPETPIVVITEKNVNEGELRENAYFEKVYFIKNDPTMHAVLKRSKVHLANSVIILADSEYTDPDAKTALISLAITNLEKNLEHKPHIIAEIVNHRKIEHLKDAGVAEWVCASDFGLGIIAQSALNHKLSEVYQQLLQYTSDTNEIYLVDSKKYPQSFTGKKFTEISTMLNNGRDSNNPAILLGIKRDGNVMLNPREDELDLIKSGDSLIVMSFDPPDLR